MFPQKHHKLDLFILKSHSRGPTAHRIIQTERLASYWLSCVAKMLRVKDEKKTNRVRSRAQRASLSYIRFGFFYSSSCVSVKELALTIHVRFWCVYEQTRSEPFTVRFTESV